MITFKLRTRQLTVHSWDSTPTSEWDEPKQSLETLALSQDAFRALVEKWPLPKYFVRSLLEKSLHYFMRVDAIQSGSEPCRRGEQTDSGFL